MGYIERKPLMGMDIVRMNSIRWTQWLQQMCGLHSSTQSDALRALSLMTESWFIYFWLYPICTLVHPLLGFRVLFAIITSDWISTVLKCIIPDDRPYWWFPTTEYSTKGARETTIYEFPETCETTSGFPSSHSTLFAACSIIILFHFRDRLKKSKLPKKIWNIIDAILLSAFLLINFAGMVGRAFVSTNFHYQSVAGFVIGCCIGKFSYSKALRLFAFSATRGIVLLSLVLGSLVLFVLGFLLTSWDPFWSVPIALKWCASTHRVYGRLSQNILYFALRVSAATSGFVYSNNVGRVWLKMHSFTLKQQVALGMCYLTELGLARLIEAYGETTQILVYSGITFFMTMFHVVSVTLLLPTLVTEVISESSGTQGGAESKPEFEFFGIGCSSSPLIFNNYYRKRCSRRAEVEALLPNQSEHESQ